MGDDAVRRTPQGERGRRRVALILEAAEQELAQSGYEQFTTNAVAARAGISIGSIYQFFPNKEALVHALAVRYHETIRALYDDLFSSLPREQPLAQMVDRLIDPLIEYNSRNRAFQTLFCSIPVPFRMNEAVAKVRAEVIDRVHALFAARRPGLAEERRKVCVLVSVHAVEALLPLATDENGAVRGDVAREIKRLLLAYLEPVLGEKTAPDGVEEPVHLFEQPLETD